MEGNADDHLGMGHIGYVAREMLLLFSLTHPQGSILYAIASLSCMSVPTMSSIDLLTYILDAYVLESRQDRLPCRVSRPPAVAVDRLHECYS
jgi:hypothetical protein